MAGRMALNLGKGAFQKMSAKNPDLDPTPMSVDHSHYQGAKVERKKVGKQKVLVLNDHAIAKDHTKNSAYYEFRGIPKKDAQILSSVVKSARYLDNGIHILGPYKIGINTFVQLIPELGDFIGIFATWMFIYLPATRISEGPDGHDKKQVKKAMRHNLAKCLVFGLLPLLGDVIDSWKKYNVRSASALEDMLLKRVVDETRIGRDAEKIGRMNGHQRAGTNGHIHTAANGHHDSEPPSHQPQRYDSESLPHQPQRYITANDLRQDSKPTATARAPMTETQPKKSAGNFFRRRGEPQSRPETAARMEEVAPRPPPRPNQSGHERVGYF